MRFISFASNIGPAAAVPAGPAPAPLVTPIVTAYIATGNGRKYGYESSGN